LLGEACERAALQAAAALGHLHDFLRLLVAL
jgi:hypothetical protein